MGREAVQRSSQRAFDYEPDKLAESFLIQHYVWDPQAGCEPEQWRFEKGTGDSKLKWWQGGFYSWRRGRYTQVDDGEMLVLVTSFLQELNRMPFDAPDPQIKITRTLVGNILLNVAGIAGVHLHKDRELNSWDDGLEKAGVITMSFVNGLVMFVSVGGRPTLVEHTPKYFSMTRLPYYYDRDAQCPRWQAFLDDVMEGDGQRIELLQQWAGYLLTNTLKFQKFMLLAGEGGNGKTVFTTVLEKMVGEENVGHIPLSSFEKPFALVSTLGKALNSTSESSHGLSELCETMLKSYTSGDRMTFERKYREPISCHPTAKVMISTNQLPNFTDKSNGIWRRMLFVPFDRTIPADEQNPELVGELAKELPGIFNWAYEGLRKLVDTGRFVEPGRCRQAIGEYRRDANPAKVFLEENYSILDAGHLMLDAGCECRESRDEYRESRQGIPCGEVYRAYVGWCEQNGYHPLNAGNFGKEVKRVFKNTKRNQFSRYGKRVWGYEGLIVKSSSETETGFVNANVTRCTND